MTRQPELLTDRLILRPIKMEDFVWYSKFWTKPEIVEFIGGEPRTTEESWMRFLMNFGSWSQLGFGFWIIAKKSSRTPIGLAGIFQAKRNLPGLDETPEAGWALTPEEFGQGYAEEAMRAILAWADEHIELETLACIIDVPNLKSARIAERLGFENLGTLEFEGADITIWARDRRHAPWLAHIG